MDTADLASPKLWTRRRQSASVLVHEEFISYLGIPPFVKYHEGLRLPVYSGHGAIQNDIRPHTGNITKLVSTFRGKCLFVSLAAEFLPSSGGPQSRNAASKILARPRSIRLACLGQEIDTLLLELCFT